MTPPTDLATVVGTNAREIRHRAGARTDDVAALAREFGLTKWQDSSVSALERGKVSPTLPTLFALSLAFSKLLDEPITLAELCTFDGNVRLTDSLVVPGDALVRALTGSPTSTLGELDVEVLLRVRMTRVMDAAGGREEFMGKLPEGIGLIDVRRALAQVGTAEQRAAKDLGVDPDRLAVICLIWYGRTFAEERDQRAGLNANAQKRGQAARALKDELRERISQDGDD